MRRLLHWLADFFLVPAPQRRQYGARWWATANHAGKHTAAAVRALLEVAPQPSPDVPVWLTAADWRAMAAIVYFAPDPSPVQWRLAEAITRDVGRIDRGQLTDPELYLEAPAADPDPLPLSAAGRWLATVDSAADRWANDA